MPDIEKCAALAKVYGVSMDSLVKTEDVEGFGMMPPAPMGKNIWGTVTVNERGQIVIPKAAREKFDLTGGKRLIVLSDENGIALIPAEQFETSLANVMRFAAMPADL